MITSREHTALSAYLKLLRNKGVDRYNLRQREVCILKLIPFINEIESDGAEYRSAVDDFLIILDPSERSAYLSIVREYFPFWMDDIKAIAALNADKAYESIPYEWMPLKADLNKLWSMLDQDILTSQEKLPVDTYEKALRAYGTDECSIDTSLKLVKLLMLRLRDAPHKEPKVYRKAVDSNLPFFTVVETHHMFLKVGREFYYFWKGDKVSDKTTRREAVFA